MLYPDDANIIRTRATREYCGWMRAKVFVVAASCGRHLQALVCHDGFGRRGRPWLPTPGRRILSSCVLLRLRPRALSISIIQ